MWWQGYGEKGTLVHWWWECKFMQPLYNSTEVSLKMKNRTPKWSRNSIPIYPPNPKPVIQKHTWTPVFMAALFITAKIWKQPKCPSTDEWIKKTWHILLLLFSHSVMSDSLWPHGLQHARLPCPSLFLKVFSNSCPLSQCFHPKISSSVFGIISVPFSSCL